MTNASIQAQAGVEGLPELPEPLEIAWPEMHQQALGCGVEDRGIRDRYEAAEYGWRVGVDRAIECVPEGLYDADQMRSYALASIASERAEVGRLKAALKWYADGNHFVLDDDWDTVSGEPQNWLMGPESGMVEDGGIARTVLDGGHMVEGDDEVIAEALLSKEQHTEKLARIKALMLTDPPKDSPEGFELSLLAGQVERYEKRIYGAALNSQGEPK